VSITRFANDAVDHCLGREWTRRIVNRDNLCSFRQILEAVSHRIAALATADGNQQAIGIAFQEPWRRISRECLGQNDDDHQHVRSRLKRLHAVKQHRLSANPAELL
jgi:hypothetical protein